MMTTVSNSITQKSIKASTLANGVGKAEWQSEGATEVEGAYTDRTRVHEADPGRSISAPMSSPGSSPMAAPMAAPVAAPGSSPVSVREAHEDVPWGGGVSPHHRQPLPSGHRFFADSERETMARFIDWALTRSKMANEGAWFTTLTFRDYVTPYRGNKMVRRWLSRLNQALENNGGSQLKSILATEWQQREVIHYHLLLAGHGLDALSRKRWECRWKALGGGFARVYDADMKAAPYLAKYLNKQRGGEVDIGGAWQGMNTPESVSVAALAGL